MKKWIVILIIILCLTACSPFDGSRDSQYNVLRPEFPGSPMAGVDVEV